MGVLKGLSGVIGGVQITSQDRPADPWSGVSLVWHEMSAATPEDYAGFNIYSRGDDAYSGGYFFVAVGPAGAEVVVGARWCCPWANFGKTFVPVSIPAGSRVSLAWSGHRTYHIANVDVLGVPSTGVNSPWSIMECGPIALDANHSVRDQGVYVDPPTVNGVKGPWTEISHSGTQSTLYNALNGDALPHAYDYLGVQFGWLQVNVDMLLHIDVAVGAAGAEEIVLENLPIKYLVSRTTKIDGEIFWMKWGRPAGARVSVRLAADDVSGFDPGLRGLLVQLYGLR